MKETKSDDDKDGKKQALFLQRFIAFLIDVSIVVMLSSLISTPFVDTKRLDTLSERATKLVKNYKSEKINTNEYVAEYINITYDLAKNNGISTLVGVVIGLVLYVLFPLYNNGQTIGKKMLKIKIISNTGELTVNQLILRSFIANSLLLNIMSVLFIMFLSKSLFFYCYGMFSIIQYIITVISIFLIINSKKKCAVHDLLVHTQVVRC